MIDIKLNDGQTGYDIVGEYIRRYWNHNYQDTVVCSIGISYDGNSYEFLNEIAEPENFDDILFSYDWWEGQKYIRLCGIKAIDELDISGGIYTED